MKGLKIEIDFNELVNDMFSDARYDECGVEPSSSFSEAVQGEIVRLVSNHIIKESSSNAQIEASRLAKEAVESFLDKEMQGIIYRKLRAGEVRINSYSGGFKSFDEIIEKNMSSMSIEKVIKQHIDRKADDFAKEMKARYDNIFAARIVSSLKDQKMLSPDVAKILLGED